MFVISSPASLLDPSFSSRSQLPEFRLYACRSFFPSRAKSVSFIHPFPSLDPPGWIEPLWLVRYSANFQSVEQSHEGNRASLNSSNRNFLRTLRAVRDSSLVYRQTLNCGASCGTRFSRGKFHCTKLPISSFFPRF